MSQLRRELQAGAAISKILYHGVQVGCVGQGESEGEDYKPKTNMTQEQQVVLMIKGAISELPLD